MVENIVINIDEKGGRNMICLDNNEQNILNLEKDTEILMAVNGEFYIYKPIKKKNGSWDMINSENLKYGLECKNLKQLKALLLADYAAGIINYTHIKD